VNALVLIDLQNDFLPGGALAVPEGDAVLPLVNALQPLFDVVVATQDWHPPDHVSFAVNHPGKRAGETIDVAGRRQILWPVHCVADSAGAALSAELDTDRIARVFHKGTDRLVDSYSALFDAADVQHTGLAAYLRERGVSEVYMCGLATDYCVKCSAIDARREGFNTHFIPDASRGIEAMPGDIARAIGDMRRAGVEVVTSAELRRRLRGG
jgi:nicotinamidase/pyrazinamidase